MVTDASAAPAADAGAAPAAAAGAAPGAAARATATVAGLVQGFQAQAPMRTGSLLVTIIGDVVAPASSAIWLADLVRLAEPFGLAQGVIRTAAYRLTQEGWLESQREGRRSRYRLTEAARGDIAAASARIYAAAPPPWDGSWEVVDLSALPAPRADLGRRGLELLGFGALSPRLMVRPAPAPDGLARLLSGPLGAQAAWFRGARLSTPGQGAAALAHQAWDLEQLAQLYAAFTQRFAPLSEGPPTAAAEAYCVRVLMIHQYRKILLRDPGLPADMLPRPWPGDAARALCAALYPLLVARSAGWLAAAAGDSLCQPAAAVMERFQPVAPMMERFRPV